jgi:hypothetical protein
MKFFGPRFFLFLLISAAAITLACGSSPVVPPMNCASAATGANSTGALEAISLCPATADAGKYPGGQVEFIATGHYTAPPSTVTPITPETWGACYQNAPTDAVSITTGGVAHCMDGASGTYTVYASDQTNCNVIGPCGAGCQISGTAKLTCP